MCTLSILVELELAPCIILAGIVCAGPHLKQLLAAIKQSSTIDAIQKVKSLQLVSRISLQHRLPETLQCLDRLLQDVAEESVKDISTCLFAVSKVANKQTDILEGLKSEPYKETVLKLFRSCSTDSTMYTQPVLVSQLCCAQYNMEIYSSTFWRILSEKHIVDWDARAAANVVFSYGKLYSAKAVPLPSSKLKDLLHEIAYRHSRRMNGQAVANVLWSFAKLEVGLGKAHGRLMGALRAQAKDMSGQAVSCSLWALLKLDIGLEEAERPVMEALMRVADSMSSQSVSIALWALAKLDVELGYAEKRVRWAVIKSSVKMNAQEVSNTLWALDHLGMPLDSARKSLLQAVVRVVDDMNAHDVSSTLGSLAKFDQRQSWLIKKIVPAIIRVSGTMNPQDVANTMWALAKMNSSRAEPAQEALLKAVCREVDHMNGLAVANTVWAFASLEWPLGKAERLLINAVIREEHEMNGQAVGVVLWAFAKLELDLGAARQPMLKAIIREVNDMNAKAVANTLDAVGSMELDLEAAHEPVLRAVRRVSSELRDQHLDQAEVGLQWLAQNSEGTVEADSARQSLRAVRCRVHGVKRPRSSPVVVEHVRAS